jgi:hypothetical protein
LDLIAQRPDLTLVETVAELRKRRIKTSRSSRPRLRRSVMPLRTYAAKIVFERYGFHVLAKPTH